MADCVRKAYFRTDTETEAEGEADGRILEKSK